MRKIKFPTELAYLLGNILVALEVVFMEKSDFGVSMVVAPAYLLYRKISTILPFFTFGMAEYTLQAVILLGMCLALRKFRISWLFSFITAVIYGLILDFFMLFLGNIPADTLTLRILWYVIGMPLGSAGISLMFHTYISPEVYELFVKVVSSHLRMDINKFKTRYDIISCALGVALSFLFFGFWPLVGVKWGTILCALINGKLIGLFSRLYEKFFVFGDVFPWRFFFTGEKPQAFPQK